MANKDLFKQAIAEAKSVREAAIANAKEALEETLTPHLKDMLAAKLQEMEDSSVEEEVVTEVEEVEEEVADQYTEASYFTVQSMRDRLHQVWGEAKEEFPDHKDDEKKIKGKKSKTDTGKDAAVVDVKPEIKERKK